VEVKVSYVFSKNTKIGSKLIVWATRFLAKDPNIVPSHCALLLNNKYILESTLEKGVNVRVFSEWLEHNELVACLDDGIIEYEAIKAQFLGIKNKKYDYPAIVYFGITLLLCKFLGIPIPKRNILQSKNKYFCCEIIGKLNDQNYQMTSPVEVMDSLAAD
jgi:hypothetical protein